MTVHRAGSRMLNLDDDGFFPILSIPQANQRDSFWWWPQVFNAVAFRDADRPLDRFGPRDEFEDVGAPLQGGARGQISNNNNRNYTNSVKVFHAHSPKDENSGDLAYMYCNYLCWKYPGTENKYPDDYCLVASIKLQLSFLEAS